MLKITLVALGVLCFTVADIIVLPTTVHDVFPCTNQNYCGQGFTDATKKFNCTQLGYLCHPDFERYTGLDLGIPQPLLDLYRLPVFGGGKTTTSSTFYTWYHNKTLSGSDNQYIIALPFNLTLQNDIECVDKPRCLNTYSYRNLNFLPIDEEGFGNFIKDDGTDTQHNYGFTMHVDAMFTYQGDETMTVTMDDDFWTFVDNKLVIDLGGVHGPTSANLKLNTLNLKVGSTYSFQMFYAERQSPLSTFSISTNATLRERFVDWCGVLGGDGQTCCNETFCSPYDLCDTVTCDAINGTCIHSALECPSDDNKCRIYCDPMIGCTNATLSCDDLNICTNDTCNPSSGCSHLNYTDYNACTDDICTSTGMDYISRCQNDTTNLCVIYSCDSNDPSGSCIETPVDCGPSDDDCVVYSCIPSAGCVPKHVCNNDSTSSAATAIPIPLFIQFWILIPYLLSKI